MVKNKMKLTISILMLLLLTPFNVLASGDHDFREAESIIQEKIPCEELNETQLEMLGDYYMEQMHPGEAHEAMDEMMGGEGSESLRLMHIRMAESFYCGNHEEVSSSMMNMMMGRNSKEMPTCTEQGCSLNNNHGGNTMMGGYGMNYGMGAWWLLYIVLGSVIFGLIFWGTYKLIMKK